MRVCFVNPVGQLGGAELSLLDLMASLPQALPGIDRHLVVTADGPLVERARENGIEVHVLPMPDVIAGMGDSALRSKGKLAAALNLGLKGLPAGLAALRYGRRLGGLLRAIRPAIVHSNGIKSHLLLRAGGLSGVPIVWHIRDFPGSRPVMAKALRWASGRTAAALAISEAVGRDARMVLGRVPVHVVYNAIDVDRFAPGAGDPEALDNLAGLSPPGPGTVRVGLVATYARWKGQDLLLDAIARIDRTDIRYYIVGGPIYQTKGSQFSVDELRGLAAERGVADRVGFVPFQKDTAAVYRALDVVVHASTHPEPFGRTIVEAMACGKPVVVAEAGGAAELFTDGRDAVGFRPGDPAALAGAIAGLAADAQRRAQIGEEARRTAVARFARERLGREVGAVYSGLVLSLSEPGA